MKIKNVCDLINGRAFKPTDWATEGVPIVRIQNLNDHNAPFNYYRGVYSEVHEINDGELLFSWSGTPGTSFGAFRWYRGKGVLNQHIFKVIPKVDVDKEYLRYALNGNLQAIIAKAHGGVGLQHITKRELDEIDIPIPSAEVQQQIVTCLHRNELVIAMRRNQLYNLDQLIKARFVEMFGDLRSNPKGWPVYCFEEITEIITDGEHATPRRADQGIYLLSARNVLDHAIRLDDVDFIDQEEYDRIAKRIIPQAGDVLISCSGSVGRCCTVPEGLKFQMVRSTALLRFKSAILPVYAEYMITSNDLQEQINSAKTASSQANLFQGKMAKLRGFVPPLELQEQFAAFVSQVDKSKFVWLACQHTTFPCIIYTWFLNNYQCLEA